MLDLKNFLFLEESYIQYIKDGWVLRLWVPMEYIIFKQWDLLLLIANFFATQIIGGANELVVLL